MKSTVLNAVKSTSLAFMKTSLVLLLATSSVGSGHACGGEGKEQSFYQDQFRVVYRHLPLKDTKEILQVSRRAVIRIVVTDEQTLFAAHANAVEWLTMLGTYLRDKGDVDSLEDANDLLTKAMDVQSAIDPTATGPLRSVLTIRLDVLSRLNRSQEAETLRKQWQV